MNEVFDYPTTPADLKCLANTIAGYLGYARKSKKSIKWQELFLPLIFFV